MFKEVMMALPLLFASCTNQLKLSQRLLIRRLYSKNGNGDNGDVVKFSELLGSNFEVHPEPYRPPQFKKKVSVARLFKNKLSLDTASLPDFDNPSLPSKRKTSWIPEKVKEDIIGTFLDNDEEMDEQKISEIWERPSNQSLSSVKILDGERLPRIESNFETCEDYLMYILQTAESELTSQDWDFILDEIVETLPAFNSETVAKYQVVLPEMKDLFVFSVCKKVNDYDNAISYYEYLKSKNENMSELARGTFFNLMSRCERDSLNWDTRRGRAFKDFCDETLSLKPENFYFANFVSIVGGLANTPYWKTALELSKRLQNDLKTTYAFRSLALASLHFRDFDVFWNILNSTNFHRDIMNMRETSSVNIDSCQDEVFIAYLKYCQELSAEQSTSEAWSQLQLLFEYFQKIFHCVRPPVQAHIEETVKILAPKTGPRITKISRKGVCEACRSTLDAAKFTKEEMAELCNAVMKKVLIQEDLYKSTMPHEIQRFNAKLAASKGYDVVIDGLNIALSRFPGVHMKTLDQQSQTIYECIKVLQKLGMKILLIHRRTLFKYPHFKQIKAACDYHILDKETADDPFVLIAAMSSGPETFILSNDTLRDHFNKMESPNLIKLFTRWQLARQLISFNEAKTVNKNLDGLTANIFFPPRHTCFACRTNDHWHIPLDRRTQVPDGQQKRMVVPKEWLCISVPKQQPLSFESLVAKK